MHIAKLYFQTETRPGFISLGAENIIFFPLLPFPLKHESKINSGHMQANLYNLTPVFGYEIRFMTASHFICVNYIEKEIFKTH